MTSHLPVPLLHVILESAVDATGAERGWLLSSADGSMTVEVEVGPDPSLGGTTMPSAGVAGYVMATGQPLALAVPAEGTPFAGGIEDHLGSGLRSVLCVPLERGGEVLGAIELVNRTGGPFTFDDVELVTVVAGIGGEALAGDRSTAVPPPERLAEQLELLAREDPARYAGVAQMLWDVLSHA